MLCIYDITYIHLFFPLLVAFVLQPSLLVKKTLTEFVAIWTKLNYP